MTATESVRAAPAVPALLSAGQQQRSHTARRRPGRILIPLFLAVLAAACGGDPTLKNPAVTGPHGIPAVPIPGGLGYGEARFESASEAAAGQKGMRDKRTTQAASGARKGSPARIAVYFLEPDGKTPLTLLPEKVQAVIGLPGTLPNHYTQAYDLTNEPRADDPAASARFASTPFPLPEQRISGRVKAVVQGQEVSFPLVLSGLP